MSAMPASAITSASPTLAQQMPAAPRSSCHLATTGDLRVGLVSSRQTDATKTTAASLVTTSGSILDGDADVAADVVANRIDLKAAGGGIGRFANDLDINSSVGGLRSGRLYAEATGSIQVTETDYELVVLAAKSTNGLVRLTVPDMNGARAPPSASPAEAAQPEDLILVASGRSIVAENSAKDVAPSTDPVSASATGTRSGTPNVAGGKSRETVIREDFAELRQAGLAHPLMDEIETAFGAGG